MLPQFVLRVRKVVRRLRHGHAGMDLTGAENRARWEAMLSEIDARDRAAEQHQTKTKQTHNRLNLN